MVNKESLKKFVENNQKLVKKAPTSNPDLFVLKYTRKVFFDGLWNEFLEQCRGLVIDKDYNIVSYPFTKIYNIGIEEKAPVYADDDLVTVYQKRNGFMVAMTEYNGELLISTTGSLDSDFVGYARSFVNEDLEKEIIYLAKKYNITLLFECVHSEDPHIIPEQPGLYYLGHREKTYDSVVDMYRPSDSYHKYLPHEASVFDCGEIYYNMKWKDVAALLKTCEHEGYVIYGSNRTSGKVKSKYYLVQKALARKKDIMSLNKNILDEEYYPLYDHLVTVREMFNSLSEEDRLSYMREFIEKM